MVAPTGIPYGYGNNLIECNINSNPPSYKGLLAENERCAENYNRTVPTDLNAKKKEIEALINEISIGINRLKVYKEKVEIIEQYSSEATAFESRLTKRLNDLKFDHIVHTLSVDQLEEYDNFLERSKKAFSEIRKSLVVEAGSNVKEIRNILLTGK